MIKNFIFDIGNVLVNFDPKTYFEQRFPNMQMVEVCALVMDHDWEKMDEGIYMCEDVRQIKLATYPNYAKQISYIFDHWMDMMELKLDSVAYMKALKDHGYGIYILSNIGEESHLYLQAKYNFFDIADGSILSYQHHLIKPNKEIYQVLLDTYHLKGDECMFFDDRTQNIKSAQALGIHGIEFINATQAKEEVKAFVKHK